MKLEYKANPNRKDLTGKTFGLLKVTGYAGSSTGVRTVAWWFAVCSCGKKVTVRGNSIMDSRTVSCGCSRRSMGVTHGKSRTTFYRKYWSMRTRCYNPKSSHYIHYGGRGIKVCSGWMDFKSFYDDVFPSFVKGLSMDRKNNNGNYSCGKCEECKSNGWNFNIKWSTDIEQMNNTRSNKLIEFNGKTKTVADWCRELGFKYNAVALRLRSGWTPFMALTTPVRSNVQKSGHSM